jgi:hypothetical protein
MFLHVCCERDTHPESLNGGAVRQFFAEDYYQIGTDKPVSLAGLEARLVEMAKDPRVLFGLCKMTVASPPLVVFDLGVEEQLEEVIRSHCSREVVSRVGISANPLSIQAAVTDITSAVLRFAAVHGPGQGRDAVASALPAVRDRAGCPQRLHHFQADQATQPGRSDSLGERLHSAVEAERAAADGADRAQGGCGLPQDQPDDAAGGALPNSAGLEVRDAFWPQILPCSADPVQCYATAPRHRVSTQLERLVC